MRLISFKYNLALTIVSLTEILTKTSPPTHLTGMITFPANSRQPRKLIVGMQIYIDPTKRNMEDDHNFFSMEDNFFLLEDYLNFV